MGQSATYGRLAHAKSISELGPSCTLELDHRLVQGSELRCRNVRIDPSTRTNSLAGDYTANSPILPGLLCKREQRFNKPL